MKTQILNYWLYLYLGCIYLVPLFYILRLNNSDTRFMLRKLFFPLEYIIQVKVEKGLSGQSVKTAVHHVSGEDRVSEIARMLSGDPGSAESREHARSMLEKFS